MSAGITPTEHARQMLEQRLAADPVIQARQRAWPFGDLTDMQLASRQVFERAMRAGQLRGTPSCFGSLR